MRIKVFRDMDWSIGDSIRFSMNGESYMGDIVGIDTAESNGFEIAYVIDLIPTHEGEVKSGATFKPNKDIERLLDGFIGDWSTMKLEDKFRYMNNSSTIDLNDLKEDELVVRVDNFICVYGLHRAFFCVRFPSKDKATIIYQI